MPDHDGNTLATLQSELSSDAIETVVSETADALRTLGLYNTVHGHLSPDEIYLPTATNEASGATIHISGFGLGHAVRGAVGESEPTAYTAPELLDDSDQQTVQTDVYSLGAVTYFALTGQSPIIGTDLTEAIREGPMSPPSAYADGISAELDDVVMQTLSISPADRYDSPYKFYRAFLNVFEPTNFTSNGDTENQSKTTPCDETDTADNEGQADDNKTENRTQEEADNQAETDDDSLVSRRTALGMFGMGVIGIGGGWMAMEMGSGDVDNSAAVNTPAETPTETSIREPLPEPTQQWTFAAGAEVRSSPAVVGGTVYIGSDDNKVYALDAEDGTKNWTFEAGARVNSSPVVASDTVYVGTWSENGRVYALDAADGTEQWSFNTNGVVPSAPAVVDGTVYADNSTTLFALSAADGTVKWQYDTLEQLYSPPTVVDGQVYFGSFIEAGRGRVYALSSVDGTEQWTFETNGAVFSAPAVDGDTVYIGSQQNIYALNRADGTEQWAFQNGIYSSPALTGDTIYVGGNNIYALSTNNGNVHWEFPTYGNVRPSPAVTGERVYVGTEEGYFYEINASDGSGEWSLNIDGAFRSSPAVVDGTVYVGCTNGMVYALEAVNDDSSMASRWPMFSYDAANIGSPSS